jgi:2-phospho-L-lactate guanylyltransferase
VPESHKKQAVAPARTAVVVPVRSFTEGKSRLVTLGAETREGIGRLAAEAVLEAAGRYPTQVVTGDSAVAEWAKSFGTSVILLHEGSLNADLEEALNRLYGAGYRRAVIALGDLPLLRPADIVNAAACGGFYLIPDRHRAGTNLLACPLPCQVRLAFGEDSFSAHLAAITDAGTGCEIDDESLARFDIDLPEDLDALAVLASRKKLTAREVNRLNSILSLAGRNPA